MNLTAITDKQADELGLEDDTKHEYVAVKVTKSNYAPMGGTVYLRRGDHGVLTYHEPQQANRMAQGDRIRQLVQLVRDEAARGYRYSKSSLSKRYGDPKGLFKMGINKLEELIEQAIAEGFLVQAPGNARILRATDKPTEIAKAKVPNVGHVHSGT